MTQDGHQPRRLRLSRAKGFKLQAASRALNGRMAVSVARPGALGNPFVVGRDGSAARCVELYRLLLAGRLCLTAGAGLDEQKRGLAAAGELLDGLRGKNLACWCRLDKPCHAEVLLALANPDPGVHLDRAQWFPEYAGLRGQGTEDR